jgi:hypothetical protein
MSMLVIQSMVFCTGLAAAPAEMMCPKCNLRFKAGAKFCSQCGLPLTRAPAKASTRPTSSPSPAMQRYESADGKLLLYHPRGWKVRQGATTGQGSCGVTVENPDQTAGVMFTALPLGEQVKDSVVMAQIFLANLTQTNTAVEVTRMASAKDRSRTRAEMIMTTADGVEMVAHIHFFHTPRAGTVFSLMARKDKWEANLPLLTKIVANLAYSPEGVKNVQKKGRDLAAGDGRVSDGQRRPLSPMAMLAAAERNPGPRIPMVNVTAPDNSFTLQIPQGWQFQGMALQYWTSPDWQRKTHGVTFVSKEMISPKATTVRVPGVIMSDYLPPPQALALLMGDGQVGRNVQVIAETPAAQVVPEVAQYLQAIEARGTRGDIRLMHVKFTSPPTGQTCRGLFTVSCFCGMLGVAWSCLVEGGWAPDAELENYVPLYWRIVKSHRYNDQFVGQVIAQQVVRQRQLNASLQRALAESRQAFQDLQGSFRDNSRARDYTAWLFSQTTLGQGSWVSKAEGGVVHQTDRWGIEREGGDRVDSPAFNNTNFTGRSPWTGEQLQEINTRPDWERYIQGRR